MIVCSETELPFVLRTVFFIFLSLEYTQKNGENFYNLRENFLKKTTTDSWFGIVFVFKLSQD